MRVVLITYFIEQQLSNDIHDMNETAIDNNITSEENQDSERSSIRLIIDWFLYCLFVVAFVLVFVVFDPVQRIAMRFGHKYHDRVIYVIHYALLFCVKLMGTRIEFIGEVPTTSNPLLVVSNHQSMWDIPMSYVAVKKYKPRFIAKKELAKWLPSVSYNLRNGYNVIIDRKDPRQSIKALQEFAKLMTAMKLCAVIFPEGTRAKTGVLKDFHSAGLNALLKYAPSADILPMCVDGSWRLNKQKKSPPHSFTTVKVYIGDLIKRAEVDDKAIPELVFNFVKERLT